MGLRTSVTGLDIGTGTEEEYYLNTSAKILMVNSDFMLLHSQAKRE